MSLLDAKGNPLISSAEQLRVIKRAKYNPLRSLGPVTLARALDNFEFGYLRDAALLFDVIAERDDTLKSVKPKREKEVSQLDWQIMPNGPKDATYEKHKEVLDDFWNNVRSVNAYDRNEKGGFKRLVRQMMTSASMRYAVHHIVWRPGAEGLRATFEFVPLWLFENTTGSLRYLRDPFAAEGEHMADDEWMITTGDGLMISCSIGYHAKRSTYNDWLIFSEKFSMPGVLGRTSAAKGTPEGNMMRDAVAAFGHDWNGVLYGDDGQHKDPIQLITADGNPSAMPMPAIIERVDRKFAALYRGADLSTMSSNDGEGTGASLQGKEQEILLRDDAEVITETLEPISRQVIQWHFGWGVEPAARLEMIVPTDEDGQFLLDASCQLADRGARVSLQSTMERLSIQTADEGEEVLGGQGAASSARTAVEEVENAATADENKASRPATFQDWIFEAQARRQIGAAITEDMQPVGQELDAILQEPDFEEMKRKLSALDSRLPELLNGTASDAAWAAVLSSALVNGYADGGRDDTSNTKPKPKMKIINTITKLFRRDRESVTNKDELPTINDRRAAVANTAEVPPIMDGGWMKVAPYGDFEGKERGRLQHFHRAEAERMVSEFNSFKGRLGRMFRGRSIFIGHPDADPHNYPDERRLGKIIDLEARADGLWAKPEWNSLGKENITEGYWVYPSPYWDAPAGATKFRPDRLISIGLTNNPRIVASEPVCNSEDKKQTTDIMDRQKLLAKLGLEAEATDEEILAKIDAYMNAADSKEDKKAAEEMKNSLDQANAEREAAENSVKQLKPELEAEKAKATGLETKLQESRTAHANTLLDAATQDGRITKADREKWDGDFAADFEKASNSLAAIKPALNTQELQLEKSRQAVSDQQSRRETIANAVDAKMAATGCEYHEAYAAVKKDPAMREVFDAMESPANN